MRAQGPTFFLLNGQTGWRTARTDGVSVSTTTGLTLFSNPAGPLALSSPVSTLGGLSLPQGMAYDARLGLFLLGRQAPWLMRFDPGTGLFVALDPLGTMGQQGHGVRQFRQPSNIALAGRSLYVADLRNRRVQEFDLDTLTLRHIWGARGKRKAWKPIDIASHNGAVYILDKHEGCIYRHAPGMDVLERVFCGAESFAESWTRVILDRRGYFYLWNRKTKKLDVFDRAGTLQDSVEDAGDVRGQFDAPPIHLDHKGRFRIASNLALPCPEQPIAADVSRNATESGSNDYWYDLGGKRTRVDPTEVVGPALYRESGTWISSRLDSELFRCQWHRVELYLAALPPGAQVEVSTFAVEESETGFYGTVPPESSWIHAFTVIGPTQDPKANPAGLHEFLVLSPPGQCFHLRIKLKGDGYSTPRVEAVRLHYPRESWLEYLPAVFSGDNPSREFLARFLSIFQTEWDDLEAKIQDMAQYFDPRSVPKNFDPRVGGEDIFLEYLAQWLALPLEGSWNTEQKRKLLMAAPRIYPRRGTLSGLADFLRVYLQNMRGRAPTLQAPDAPTQEFCQPSEGNQGARTDESDFPQIVEGFRERRRFRLSGSGGALLGQGAPLWSPSFVGRLQLDRFAQEGQARLVSFGEPEDDAFQEFAHRFRVFVPSSWIRTAKDEAMLRRALDAEKPAHTAYELHLVEPRFRVGIQSTVGIDTIIGAIPRARLACPHDTDIPACRPPHYRLGYDTVLSAGPTRGPQLRLDPSARVGVDTILT